MPDVPETEETKLKELVSKFSSRCIEISGHPVEASRLESGFLLAKYVTLLSRTINKQVSKIFFFNSGAMKRGRGTFDSFQSCKLTHLHVPTYLLALHDLQSLFNCPFNS